MDNTTTLTSGPSLADDAAFVEISELTMPATAFERLPTTAMAATVGIAHPDLPAELTTSPGQKRKRASESASPDSRRSKRGAPTVALPVTDGDAQSFLGDTVSIAQAAHDHVNVDDFSALAQATAADHHADAADTTSASTTAAAALSMYPSLHVPQSTEEAFAAQATPENHHDETGFGSHAVGQAPPDGLPLPPPPSTIQQPSSNGVPQEPRYSAPPNAKPAVGSEEWHKMRKDNHKEGKSPTFPILAEPFPLTIPSSGTSPPRDDQRGH